MWLFRFFKALYVLVHITATVILWVADQIHWIRRKLMIKFQGNLTHDKQLAFLNSECKRLDKIPTHLTVLIGQELPSCEDLANLVVWCLACGISFVSFYDHKGKLKETQSNLIEAVEKRKPEAAHIIWHNKNDLKNGYVGRKIHVKLLSLEDGQDSIVRITKDFAREKATDIDINVVNAKLKQLYEFPDPELAVYCGTFFSLSGYPPWQVRVTEFLNLQSHRGVDVYTFLALLRRYSKCEQRLGK